MAIPYHTAKFNSNNGVKNVVLGQTAKFNDRQYFRLYGMLVSLLALFAYFLALPSLLLFFNLHCFFILVHVFLMSNFEHSKVLLHVHEQHLNY